MDEKKSPARLEFERGREDGLNRRDPAPPEKDTILYDNYDDGYWEGRIRVANGGLPPIIRPKRLRADGQAH